jgi:signal transduction histidine kinase
MSGSVDEIIRTVRKISSELRPALLDDLGLAAALEWQLKAFEEQAMVETSLSATLDESYLGPDARVGFFRISQEALTNIARHAGASRVDVELSEQAGEIRLVIKDNGCGAKESELSKPTSMGILGMKERAYAFGARVEITGDDGRGTNVLVKMPIGEVGTP